MSLDEQTERLRRLSPQLAGLGYKVKFVLADEGVIFVDGTVLPPVVSPVAGNDEQDADCTIRIAPDNFEKLLAGELNPTLAYTLGKLKIDGSVGVALKLASLLEG